MESKIKQSVENTTHTLLETQSEIPKKGKPLPLKYEAFQILRENGLNQSDAAKALGYSKGSGTLISRKLNQKDDLLSKRSVSLAAKAHRLILGSFVDPEKVKLKSSIELKGSDINKAIDRVYDRAQPLIQRSLNLNANVDFHPVALEDYL